MKLVLILSFAGIAFVSYKTPSCTSKASNSVIVAYAEGTGGSSRDTLYLQQMKETKYRKKARPQGKLNSINITYAEGTGGSSRDTLYLQATEQDTIYLLPRKIDTLYFLSIPKNVFKKRD